MLKLNNMGASTKRHSTFSPAHSATLPAFTNQGTILRNIFINQLQLMNMGLMSIRLMNTSLKHIKRIDNDEQTNLSNLLAYKRGCLHGRLIQIAMSNFVMQL